MVNINSFIAKDLKHVWHPCSYIKTFEHCPPIVIEKAKGSYLYTNHGPLIDATSSWWCKSLGHGHPAIQRAITNQLRQFDHVIGANTTHSVLVAVAEQLAEITGKQRAFFASDGAMAIEIALKLALYASKRKGLGHKNSFISLKNSYHGETIATMSISDVNLYKEPYSPFTFSCDFIDAIPYVLDSTDAIWHDCSPSWPDTLAQLEAMSDTACALIIEPIIQGVGGMQCYSADFLRKITQWAKMKGIYLIADEIMTGIGRTGTWLGSDQALIQADMICLGKGLTGGTLPLSCVMIDEDIFTLFAKDKPGELSFLHSNTFSGHALALSAALATIQTIKKENILAQASELEHLMRRYFMEINAVCGKLKNIRGIGAVMAADLINPYPAHLLSQAIYEQGLKFGALLRPIGNTLYWLPPLNTNEKIIGKLAEITLKSIQGAYLELAV